MTHHPAQGKLVCSYCGYSEDIAAEKEKTEAKEYDLEEALRSGVFKKGWGTELKSIACKSCGATCDISPTVAATSCAFCGSTQVMEQKGAEDVFTPETVIPFTVDKNKALDSFKQWIGGGLAAFFRPSALKSNWNLGKIAGMYLPFWTFDSDTHSRWNAMAGHYYYEEVRDSAGNKKKERRTRWEPASGSHQEFFNDELVFASKGLNRNMVERIYPYDLKKLTPYKTEYLAGWGAERYTVGLKEAWETGKKLISEKIQSACARKVPGDTHKDLRVSTSWRNMKFKHVLLPVWVANYEFGGKVYKFLVNGENGKVHGEAPLDWVKVIAAVVIGLVIAGILYAVLQ